MAKHTVKKKIKKETGPGPEISPPLKAGQRIVTGAQDPDTITRAQGHPDPSPLEFLRALGKRFDPTPIRTDACILFEREFKEAIDQCEAETGVRLRVFERRGNGRLEIHLVAGGGEKDSDPTVDNLRRASRHYLDLLEALRKQQGSSNDGDRAYEGFWRKWNIDKIGLPEIASDLNAVITESLDREMKAGYGFDTALYYASYFMDKEVAEKELKDLLENLRQGGSTVFGDEVPISVEMVRNKLKWWGKHREHENFTNSIEGSAKTR